MQLLFTGRGPGNKNWWEQTVGQDDHWEEEGKVQEIDGSHG